MHVERAEDIGPHYAETLRLWRKRFHEHSVELGNMGFDDEFQRKWEYYFSYCEAGFAAGYISDWQMVVVAS